MDVKGETKMKIDKQVKNMSKKATSTPGAIAIAALVGIGAFLFRRKFMGAKPLTAAMGAATLAASAFGAAKSSKK